MRDAADFLITLLNIVTSLTKQAFVALFHLRGEQKLNYMGGNDCIKNKDLSAYLK
jgi:hypothetical protein